MKGLKQNFDEMVGEVTEIELKTNPKVKESISGMNKGIDNLSQVHKRVDHFRPVFLPRMTNVFI